LSQSNPFGSIPDKPASRPAAKNENMIRLLFILHKQKFEKEPGKEQASGNGKQGNCNCFKSNLIKIFYDLVVGADRYTKKEKQQVNGPVEQMVVNPVKNRLVHKQQSEQDTT
jgi:hypothetical protein